MNSRGVRAIHPGTIFAVTWAIALFFWATASEHVVYTFFPAGRIKEIGPYLYLFGFICSFLIFCFYSTRKINRRSVPTGLVNRAFSDRLFAKLFCMRAYKASKFMVMIGLLALFVHLLSVYLEGGLTVYENFDVFEFRTVFFSGTIQAVTIFKYFALPGFILATIVCQISRKWRFQSFKRKANWIRAFSCLIPLTSVLIGTRSMALLWVVPYLYLVAAIRLLFLKKKMIPWRIGAIYFIVGVIIIGSLFALGEYQRRYARIESGSLSAAPFVGIEDPSFAEFSFYAIQSYFFRTTNNGLALVAFLKNHTVLWSTFRWAYTGFGIEDWDPGGLIYNAKINMRIIEMSGYGFFKASNSGMPGALFIDWGWFALGVSAIGGLIVGALFNRLLACDITAFISLPILMFGLVETWQSGILFKSPVMVPIITGVAAGWYLKKRIATILARRKAYWATPRTNHAERST